VDSPDALAIQQLSKTFGGTRALRQVDLDIRPGEVHALVGQNGSGKSTLIKVLAGFHTPDPGCAATVSGEPLRLGDAADSHRAGLRFVHQDLGLVGQLGAVENLSLGFGYSRTPLGLIDWREHETLAKEAIRSFGHDFDVREPVANLSVVEQTVVAIARALQGAETAVSVLVLDEPTSAMPAPDVEHLLDLVTKVRARGTAVLYVSHRLGEIFRIADRVTVLRDGAALGPWPVADLTRRDIVEKMTNIAQVDDVLNATNTDTDTDTNAESAAEVVLDLIGVGGHTVSGLDLQVRKGELLGVAGIAGSGREELCDLVFGGKARTGQITVGSRWLPPGRPDQSVRQGLALVPADRLRRGVIRDLSVRENLTLPSLRTLLRFLLVRRNAERRTAQAWIERLGVKTPGLEAGVETLSGGNQQKVVLAKCLMIEPDVLLLDEPTQGVDVAAKADIHRQIARYSEAGGTVLVCSSDNEELESLCRRVLVLRNGEVVAELLGPDVNLRRLTEESLGTESAVPDRKDAR